MTRLSVRFLEHDIEPVYQTLRIQNKTAATSELHRDLKGEAIRPPAYNLRAQQRKLDLYMSIIMPPRYFRVGPRISAHMRSRRKYRDKVEEWFYPAYFQIHRVCKNGAFRWRNTKWVMVATSLSGKDVGLEEIGTAIWRVFFRQKLLGYFEEQTLRIQNEIERLKKNYI